MMQISRRDYRKSEKKKNHKRETTALYITVTVVYDYSGAQQFMMVVIVRILRQENVTTVARIIHRRNVCSFLQACLFVHFYCRRCHCYERKKKNVGIQQ